MFAINSCDLNCQVIPMPVPSSYNDVTQNRTIRDFVGWVWYDRTFFYPKIDPDQTRVMLRFGSAHYTAKVTSRIMHN